MFDKEFWQKIFINHAENDTARRKIISESSAAQHLAKQAIFDLQRNKENEAQEKLKQALEMFQSLEKRFGSDQRLRNEGSWKAGLEEFVEAKLFMDFYSDKAITGLSDLHVETEEYLGGLSDLTGEIVRMMVIWTIKNDFVKITRAHQTIDEVIANLMENNFGGYLRTKFDQAKRNLQRSEQILYDWQMNKNKNFDVEKSEDQEIPE